MSRAVPPVPRRPDSSLSPVPGLPPLAATIASAGSRHFSWNQVRRYRDFYFFVAPFFVLFAVFGLYPLLFSLGLSFASWDGLTSIHWIGLGNFAALLEDEILRRSLWNTFIIGVIYVPPMLAVAFLLALALNQDWLWGRAFFRASIFVPCVTPMVVIAIVFGLLLGSERGILNYALTTVGLPAVPWLDEPRWSKAAVAMLVAWRWTGYNMVLMLAGLQGIPRDYYEAAAVDGAGPMRRAWHVTLPLMRPTFLFATILSVVGTVYLFDEVFVLTAGGPGISSMNFGVYLFNLSFRDFRFGYASCVAYTVSAGVLAVSLLLNWLRHRGHA